MYVQIFHNCEPFREHGEDVGCQFIDIALRVELVRRYSENQPRPSGIMNLLPPDACSAILCKVFLGDWRMWRYT
jgi:hypothetical protein